MYIISTGLGQNPRTKAPLGKKPPGQNPPRTKAPLGQNPPEISAPRPTQLGKKSIIVKCLYCEITLIVITHNHPFAAKSMGRQNN